MLTVLLTVFFIPNSETRVENLTYMYIVVY